MTLPDGHGNCLRHLKYDFDCDDFERLRARAGDRCEMPGCGVTGSETKSGILFIDHEGPIYGPGARVRGLLCCGCNNGLGRAETRPGLRGHRSTTDAELAYLARPFWCEPEQMAIQEWKDARRAYQKWLVGQLNLHDLRRRSTFDGMTDEDAIIHVLRQGVRAATIYRNTRHPECRVSKASRRWRELDGCAHAARLEDDSERTAR